MSTAYSPVRNATCILIGTVLNLILLAAPAILTGTPLARMSTDAPFVGFIAMLTFWLVCESALSTRLANERPTAIKSRWIPYTTGLSIYLILSISAVEHFSSQYLPIQPISRAILASVGAALMLTGTLLRLQSVRQLGNLFESHIALVMNHRLVSTGLYSIVRHPSELGLLLLSFGVVIMLASPLGFALTLMLLLPLTLLRISREDILLHRAFADDFEHYKHAVPALWPLFHRSSSHEFRST